MPLTPEQAEGACNDQVWQAVKPISCLPIEHDSDREGMSTGQKGGQIYVCSNIIQVPGAYIHW